MISIDIGVTPSHLQKKPRKCKRRLLVYGFLLVTTITFTCLGYLHSSLDQLTTHEHEEDIIIFEPSPTFVWNDKNGAPSNDPRVLSNFIETVKEHLKRTHGEAALATPWPVKSILDGKKYKVPEQNFGSEIPPGTVKQRLKRIRRSMTESWLRYKECAWGSDNLHPDSCHGTNWFGFGLTIVDSIDTMYLMGMWNEVKEARDFCSQIIFRNGSNNANIFEVTIRVLGSFLAMFGLTHETIYFNKATELGELLIKSGAFDTRSGVPKSDIDFPTGKAHYPACPGCSRYSSLSEATTIQLEFNELSRLSNNSTYKIRGDGALGPILRNLPANRLPRIYVDVNSGQTSGWLTLGARGDSYYEYLLKQSIQTDDKRLFEEYLEAMESIKVNLLKSSSDKLTYVAEMDHNNQISDKMDHLVCFLPGNLALGTLYGAPNWHLLLAEDLMRTCMAMYHTRTGLAPEIVKFDKEFGIYISKPDEFSLLRPETAESLFILWRITKKTRYRNWSWYLFSAMERHARDPETGYSSMSDVNTGDPKRRDSVESFFLAETLKYLYLINLPDDILPLTHYIFNTEAHPLPLVRDFHWFRDEGGVEQEVPTQDNTKEEQGASGPKEGVRESGDEESGEPNIAETSTRPDG